MLTKHDACQGSKPGIAGIFKEFFALPSRLWCEGRTRMVQGSVGAAQQRVQKRNRARSGPCWLLRRSAADHPTVIFPDNHGGRTGRHAHRVAVRPGAAYVALPRSPLLRGSGSTRVLHVDEHGLLIRGGDHAGDFLANGAGQKATQFAGVGISAEHGVVAEHLEYAAVLAAFTNIGLDPYAAVLVDPQAVRRAEQVVGGQGGAIRAGAGEVLLAALPGIAAEQEDIPFKGGRGVFPAGLGPANDMPMTVLGARVGAVGFAATAVI